MLYAKFKYTITVNIRIVYDHIIIPPPHSCVVGGGGGSDGIRRVFATHYLARTRATFLPVFARGACRACV